MKRAKESIVVMVSLLALVLLNSCEEESSYEQRVKEDDNRIKTFLNENGISATKHSSGIYYDILETSSVGDKVQSGDVVSFYYKLTTLDSSYQEVIGDSLHPVMIEQSYNRAIPSGIVDGLSLMKEAEKFRFFIPSYLAYRNYSKTNFFGPFSIFIIDVEIVDIQEKDDVLEWELDSIDHYIANNNIEDVESFTSGLKYKVLEEGDGDKPVSDSQVKIKFTRKYLDGSEVESPSQAVTTQVNTNYMIEGLVEGIKKMKEGEKAMFIMPSKLAYGGSVLVLPVEIREDLMEDELLNINVLPFSPIIFEVELIEVK